VKREHAPQLKAAGCATPTTRVVCVWRGTCVTTNADSDEIETECLRAENHLFRRAARKRRQIQTWWETKHLTKASSMQYFFINIVRLNRRTQYLPRIQRKERGISTHDWNSDGFGERIKCWKRDKNSRPRSKSESNDDSEATHEEEHANSCGCAPMDSLLHSAASGAKWKSTVSLTFERLKERSVGRKPPWNGGMHSQTRTSNRSKISRTYIANAPLYHPGYGTTTIGTLDYVENIGLTRKVHTATVHMKHAFPVLKY